MYENQLVSFSIVDCRLVFRSSCIIQLAFNVDRKCSLDSDSNRHYCVDNFILDSVQRVNKNYILVPIRLEY